MWKVQGKKISSLLPTESIPNHFPSVSLLTGVHGWHGGISDEIQILRFSYLCIITKGLLALFLAKEYYLHQLSTQAVVLCWTLLPHQFPRYSVLFCLDNWAAFATQLLLNYSVCDDLWLGLIVQHLQDRLMGRTLCTGLTATAQSQRCAWWDPWTHHP